MSSPVHDWLLQLQQWYDSDDEAQSILSKLALRPESESPFARRNGVIMCKQRIWLGSNTALHNRVLSALHNSPVGGHSGAPVT